MSLLVLSEHDVERLLDMESCVEAVAEVLESLARGELFLPLRFVGRFPSNRPSSSRTHGLWPSAATVSKSSRRRCALSKAVR